MSRSFLARALYGLAVLGMVVLVLLPLLVALGWYVGWLSFETGAMILLVLIAYFAGGDGGD